MFGSEDRKGTTTLLRPERLKGAKEEIKRTKGTPARCPRLKAMQTPIVLNFKVKRRRRWHWHWLKYAGVGRRWGCGPISISLPCWVWHGSLLFRITDIHITISLRCMDVPFSDTWCYIFKHHTIVINSNTARVRNCPDIAISNSLFGLCLSSFCLFCLRFFVFFVFLSFFYSVFLSFCLDITLIKCLKGLKCQKSLFVSKF